MKMKNLMSFLYFVGFVVVIGGLYAFTTSAIADYSKPNQPEWENLKVLPQDISKDSLSALMKGYTKALGVDCSYCHAPKRKNSEKLDFASDEKIQKLIARGMIEMTNAINADYFRPHYPDPKPKTVTDVTCIMCHRGSANPKKYFQNIEYFYPGNAKEH